jgi:hypothetical protein
MLPKDFILSKTRTLLCEFLAPMLDVADRPRKRFLRQSIAAILLSGSLVVMEMAWWISDRCSDRFYRVKRLLHHLVSPNADMRAVATAYRCQMARYVQPDTPIIIDLTDLAKPRARKMKYLKLVRDASEDKLVPGYLCVEVYAHLKSKRIVPLALDSFSVDDPAVGSQNLQITRTIEAVNDSLDGKGIWVADRGFDAVNLYESWFSIECNFVVRQRGDRCVITNNGVRIIQSDLVERLRRRQADGGGNTDIVFARVTLPDHDKPLYIVANWRPKHDKPMILMTTMIVENRQQAQQILRYYKKRWACEEASQFLKGRVGLERFRVHRYEAIQRLCILAMFAMGFLTWILIRSKLLTRAILHLTSRFRKDVKFVYYRLLDGLQDFAKTHQLRCSKIPLLQSQNG